MQLPTTLSYRKSELPIDIDAVEKHYSATYVGDFCVKDANGQYVTDTAAVFWQAEPPVEGYSNYLALFVRGKTLYVTSGASAVEKPITGIVADDGEIVYSRHRWDNRRSADGSVTIDGGRDYIKTSGHFNRLVKLVVNGPTIEVHPLEQQ